MPDPFDDARREMDRAWAEFDKHLARARSALERAAEHLQSRVPDIAQFVEARLAEARRRSGKPRQASPGGLTRKRRPRGPKSGPSPMPAPVRPFSPSHLSGGAEAPLDP